MPHIILFPSYVHPVYPALWPGSMGARCWWRRSLPRRLPYCGERFEGWGVVPRASVVHAFACSERGGICRVRRCCLPCSCLCRHPLRWGACSHPWRSSKIVAFVVLRWSSCFHPRKSTKIVLRLVLVQDGGKFFDGLVVIDLVLCFFGDAGLQFDQHLLCCLQCLVGLAKGGD